MSRARTPSPPKAEPIAGRLGRSVFVLFTIALALLWSPCVALAQLPAPVGSDVRVVADTIGGVVLGDNATTMLKLINKARAARGLVQVRPLDVLCSAARAHSRGMLSADYFSHYSRSGESLASRLVRYGYSREGYSSWCVGEVIGWGKGIYGTPEAVFRAWMASSSHRTVILDRRWRDIGLGVALGTYRGLTNVYMYTVDFGRRIR